LVRRQSQVRSELQDRDQHQPACQVPHRQPPRPLLRRVRGGLRMQELQGQCHQRSRLLLHYERGAQKPQYHPSVCHWSCWDNRLEHEFISSRMYTYHEITLWNLILLYFKI